jgi:cytochrome oxidase assembly protein ShyY1
MKLIGVIGTGILSLTLGATALAYPQQEQHDQQEENKQKPAQEEKKAQPEKSAKPQEKNTRQEEKNVKPEERTAQKNKDAQGQHPQEAKPGKQDEHAGANGGGRIPADRYKANFGQAHRFRVNESDYRNRRFQYGGYWFGFQAAWPSNWLYTQDVYVVEIDGVYYLCNANYPGVNLMLSVTL